MAKKEEYEAVPFNAEAVQRLKASTTGLRPISKEKLKAPPHAKSSFAVHPDQAKKAMATLADYVAERIVFATTKENLENTVAAIKIMDMFDRLADEVKAKIKSPLENAYNVMRFAIVPAFMDEEDITQISVEDVGRVNLQDDVSVKVEDKSALFEWLKENEFEDLIVEQVNAQTLAAFVRKRLKANERLPTDERNAKGEVTKAGAIAITPVVRAVITRSK